MQRQSPQSSGEYVDLRHYAQVLRKRAWIIALTTILGFGLAVAYSAAQTPIYEATAKILVNPPPTDSSQNPSNLVSMETEAQVVESAPIANAAADALGSSLSTRLLKQVSVNTTPGTFILAISYWDPDPVRAAQGANAFAKAYLDYKRDQTNAQLVAQQSTIEEQIAELQRQQREQNAILENNSPGTIEYRNARDTLNQLSIRLAVLASALAEVPQIVNPGQVILPAQPPREPSSPKTVQNAALGLIAGLFAGVAAAFALDRMDDRVHRASDLAMYVDAPLLAYVPHVKTKDGQQSEQLVVHRRPRSPAAEVYRTLRTSVLSIAGRRRLNVFGVVSPMQREGKSMTSANLAAALGQADKRVLILSADIRKPGVHAYLGVRNVVGLSEVLAGETSVDACIQPTVAANVWLLSGGQFPTNPAELLESQAMSDVIEDVRTKFDFVIVDCPPVLGLSDTLAVLPLTDIVLLVVKSGKTRGGAIQEVGDRLARVGVTVDAVVLNDFRVARGRPGHHAYGYYRASPDYFRSERAERRSARRAASRTPDAPSDIRPEGPAVAPVPATRAEPTQPGQPTPAREGVSRSPDEAPAEPRPVASPPNGAVAVTQTHPSTATPSSST